MPRLARGEYLDPGEVQIVHAVQRCVRRAFLCGKDRETGKSFEHRRDWIRQRIEFLAAIFGVDCLTYAVMSNHFHVVLRSRPDVVKSWSDEEVAKRWLRLFPQSKRKDGAAGEPTDSQLNSITENKDRLAQVRSRLSDISWWMRCTAENLARQANREDECTGRFWEGRYKAQLILDEASLLACAAYVDLNPIRAAMAKTPESSTYTGVKDRIDDLKERSESAAGSSTHEWERSRRRQKSGWLSPIEIHATKDPTGPDVDTSARRASKKGFLEMSLAKYLALLDWTGRKLSKKSQGKIPAELQPILSRLGMEEVGWCKLVKSFGKLFKRVAGTKPKLVAEANRRGQQLMQAPGAVYFADLDPPAATAG